MLGILPYLWRLVPGNPILQRVVATASRRRRDLITRCGYLGLLIAFVVYALVTQLGAQAGGSLTALAKVSGNLFHQLSYIQLGLVALLAPVFTAGAITQERDSQTYDVLLATPLTNGQIVLGTLLSRVFFVVALLVSGVPVFSITQIFGGVGIGAIVMSFLIAASTAVVTGALAIAIATLKVGTRRTIFAFYLFIAVYLVGGILLDRQAFVRPTLLDGSQAATSWVTGVHPFLALKVVFNLPEYQAPEATQLPAGLRWWPLGWYFASPAGFYVTAMLGLSLALVLPSIALLRVLAQTTISPKAWLMTRVGLSRADRTRAPRVVWSNPIAWREAKTKGSATQATVIRWGFVVLGLIGAGVVLVGYAQEQEVRRYTSMSAYDREGQAITIFEDGKAPQFAVPPNIIVKYTQPGGKIRDGSISELRSRMEVVDYQFTGRMLTQVTLGEIPRRIPAKTARNLLLGLVLVEAAAILLIVTNAAASTVTREKEDGTLDLLLTTPITSRYYIWGKLRGLVMFVVPLIVVPSVSVLAFVLRDALGLAAGSQASWAVFPEAVLLIPLTLVILSAFAAITGMNMSLRCRTTVRAVMFSVGLVAGVCGLLGFCGNRLLTGTNAENLFSLGVASFSPFTVLMVILDPYSMGGQIYDEPERVSAARMVLVVFGAVSAGTYAAVVWSMYATMVKNFDMTIRRQSR